MSNFLIYYIIILWKISNITETPASQSTKTNFNKKKPRRSPLNKMMHTLILRRNFGEYIPNISQYQW